MDMAFIPGLSTPELLKLSDNRISSIGDNLFFLDSPDTEIDLSSNLITHLSGKSILEINYIHLSQITKRCLLSRE